MASLILFSPMKTNYFSSVSLLQYGTHYCYGWFRSLFELSFWKKGINKHLNMCVLYCLNILTLNLYVSCVVVCMFELPYQPSCKRKIILSEGQAGPPQRTHVILYEFKVYFLNSLKQSYCKRSHEGPTWFK